MDGLCAGVAFVASLVLLLNAISLGEFFVSLILVAFMGSLLGFLLFNFFGVGGVSHLPGRLRQPLHRLRHGLPDPARALPLPRLEHALPGADAGAGAGHTAHRHLHGDRDPVARGPAHLRGRQPPPLASPGEPRLPSKTRGALHLARHLLPRPRRAHPAPRQPEPRAARAPSVGRLRGPPAHPALRGATPRGAPARPRAAPSLPEERLPAREEHLPAP